MNTQDVLMPLQDAMVNKIILENLLTKGKVTIEEAYFINELIENITTKIFEPEIKQIEESLKIQTKNFQDQQPIEENSINTKENTKENTEENIEEKFELDESTMIKLFLKK